MCRFLMPMPLSTNLTPNNHDTGTDSNHNHSRRPCGVDRLPSLEKGEVSMDKSTQDLNWQCLPCETRDKIRIEYRQGLYPIKNILIDLFGHHNLTSDTEPSELLMVERKTITDIYEANERIIDNPQWAKGRRDKSHHVNSLFETIFGDKCLPYQKEWKDTGSGAMGITPPAYKLDVRTDTPNTPNSGELKLQVAENEPKFKVGDKVKIKNTKQTGTIKESYSNDAGYRVYFEDGDGGWDEEYSADKLEPYTEEKEPMEEKELNLCELLKGCEGEVFYSLMFGEVTFKGVIEEPNLSFGEKPIATDQGRYLPNAMYGLEGVPTLFPSRALYEKYPLDARAAWMEWKETREPKRQRAEKGERYWVVDSVCEPVSYQEINAPFDDDCYEAGNYFRTEEKAQQAAEAVRETLTKFHEQNKKQNGEKEI